MQKSKYQKDEVVTIERPQIKGAPYNPRIISEEAKNRLKKGLKKHGLVSTITWNKRTGNLVGGHRRLEILDILEGSPDYMLHVSMVDVPEKEEMQLNVQLNNPSMQGEWDYEKLADIVIGNDIAFGDLGFSEADSEIMFGGDSRLADLFHDTEEVAQTKAELQDIKNHRQEYADRIKDEQTANFIITIVASNQAEKENLCKSLNIPTYENFISAAQIESKIQKKAVSSGK